MPEPSQQDRTSYQTLYRRFRPQRFDEVLGQDQVSLALRNAVREGRTGHAYLFSGPRGTGKTSTARILAKALNCAAPVDGEPCGICGSCIEIARGSSMDVHELDAASNNGVEAMRDLVVHSALGTPGRWKVYIVDEVHMLSTAASNALLKTLEEPPRHVVFVLATTDAQKVLPTIRSRTQHFEFRLLGPELLGDLLKGVREQAGLDVGEDALESAVRKGRGSARDALSALDQVAAGGVLRDEVAALEEMADALAERDPARVLVALAGEFDAGLDAQRLASELADHLRQGFLAVLAPQLVSVTGEQRTRVEEVARRLGLPALVRAMEALGRALVDMREAPDPRVHLEATLIRLAHPELDESTAALLERVERLERALDGGELRASPKGSPSGGAARGPAAGTRDASPVPVGAPSASNASPDGEISSDTGHAAGTDEAAGTDQAGDTDEAGDTAGPGASGPALARRALSELRSEKSGKRRTSPGPGATARAETLEVPAPTDCDGPAPADGASFPSRDELVQVWGDELLVKLPSKARVRYRVGRFLSSDGASAVFALPNETHRSYCEEVRAEVETALRSRFGVNVPLMLVVDSEGNEGPAGPAAERVASSAGVAASPTSRATPRPPTSASASASASASQTDNDLGQGSRATASRSSEDEEDRLLDRSVLEAETSPAGAGPSPEERIKAAFPGAVEV